MLPSTASESPGKTRHESQFPLSPQTEQHERTGDPLFSHTHQATQNGMLIKLWSSQEWKSDELMEDRTGRPVVNSRAHEQIHCGKR